MIKIDRALEFRKGFQDDLTEQFNFSPSTILSKQELSDFIATEFQKAHDITNFGSYEELLDEVFELSEDDIDVSFSFDEQIMQLLQRFQPENWSFLDEKAKLDSIKELAESIADRLGIYNVPNIEYYDGDVDDCGFYAPYENTIGLNAMYLDSPKELVNTLSHEMRHVYQHIRADILETHNDALYRVNFENYIEPLFLFDGTCLFYMEYFGQYVEVDARAFANLFTEAMNHA